MKETPKASTNGEPPRDQDGRFKKHDIKGASASKNSGGAKDDAKKASSGGGRGSNPRQPQATACMTGNLWLVLPSRAVRPPGQRRNTLDIL